MTNATGSQKADIADPRPHRPDCKLVIGIVRGGVVGCVFIRGGGWSCHGCIDDRAAQIAHHLEAVATHRRILWIGQLDDTQRRSAARRARRLDTPGRITASRRGAPALMLAEANLTPRTRALRPRPTVRAIAEFIDALRHGPPVRRVDWDQTWRPEPEPRTSEAGVRAGMGRFDQWLEAVRAAGFEPGYPLPPGVSDAEAAARIQEMLEDVREGAKAARAAWAGGHMDSAQHVS
ncbi:MAG TPA: hypothetical protein VKZ72_05440 [Acidimicrobiales bacterium]|nr:hypothetical protein [Acidimicrobiales bacterium]